MTGGDHEHRLTADGCVAVVDDRGATLRSLTIDGHRVLSAPPAWDPAAGHHGAVLAPWPNRIANGVYRHGRARHQLRINDPHGHALHGHVYDRRWTVVGASAASVTLGTRCRDEPGYPFDVELQVRYALAGRTLRVEASWANRRPSPALFALGFHPYLDCGPGGVDGSRLTVLADGMIDTDLATKLPTRLRETGPLHQIAEGREIGSARFSRAYRRLSGSSPTVRLVGADGRVVELTTSLAWVQVYTGDVGGELDRTGLAVEPQSAPPDAFNSDPASCRLGAGERRSGWWSLTAHPPRD